MNFKVSKIITGISALIIAGIISVAPANLVHAGEATYSNENINVYNNGVHSIIPGNLHYSYTGTTDTPLNHDMTIDNGAPGFNGQFIINSSIAFTNPIDSSGTCSVEFNFTYQGVAYYGIINLYNQGNHFITNPAHPEYLSSYVDTRNLAGPQAFARAINEKVNEIDMAFNGLNADGTVNETKTVEYNYNYAISEKIIEKLVQAEGVTLLYTFEYEGYVFTSAITSEDAAKIFSKDIPWYGPCYIASNCPTVMVGVAN